MDMAAATDELINFASTSILSTFFSRDSSNQDANTRKNIKEKLLKDALSSLSITTNSF